MIILKPTDSYTDEDLLVETLVTIVRAILSRRTDQVQCAQEATYADRSILPGQQGPDGQYLD